MSNSLTREPYGLIDTELPMMASHDPSSWPSSYYGRTRRIDLAQLYSDTLKAVQQQERMANPNQPDQPTQENEPRRQVTFADEPPSVHEYEQVDYEDHASLTMTSEYPVTHMAPFSLEHNHYLLPRDGRDDSIGSTRYIKSSKKPPKLDLRPVPNLDYQKPPDLVSPTLSTHSTFSSASSSNLYTPTSPSPSSSMLSLNIKASRWNALLTKFRRGQLHKTHQPCT